VNPDYSSPIATVDRAAPGTINGRDVVDKSEQIALGILLNRPGEISDALELVPEMSLADPCHRAIRRVLGARSYPDTGARALAVIRESASIRALRSRGDTAVYVGQLVGNGSGDLAYHARLIREAATKRDLIARLERLTSAVRLDDWGTVTTDLEEALGAVNSSITQQAGDQVRLRSADEFAMKGTKWLYKGRIPAGMMTILAGREGIGKSTVSLDLVARVTKGALDGRYFGRPQNVILCATEDSWEHTILPRLKAVGADLSRVFHISVQDEMGRSRPISAPGDVAAIEKVIRRHRPVLMVIDPLMAVVDGKVNTNNQQQVQQALEPIVQLCGRTMMALLALIHVNKSGSTDALNTVMASKAFTSLPRSVLFCIADPEDEGNYLFTHEKCNVGKRMPSVSYRLSSVRFELDPALVEEGDEPFIESSRVNWGEEDDRSASDILVDGPASRSKGELRTGLVAFIDDRSGAVPVADLHRAFVDGEMVKKATVDVTLGRMVKKGEIDRPSHGLYQSAKLRPKS
jgi:archaellum biogenesis ATPase FlaH